MAQAIIGALRAELYAGVAKFAADMNKAAEQVSKFAARYKKIGKEISKAGKEMSTKMSAPIAAIGGLALNAAGNFEAGMNRVQAATGATADEFAAMRDLAKEMGITTQFSASQAADGMEILAKNGLTAQQILGGATEASLKLAAATGSELADAGDVATDVMLNFNKEAGELGKVVDGVTGVLLASKFGFDDYRLALGQAGGVAGNIGVQLEDFNAVIAATSSAFASGSDAGTSFKNFLVRLVPSSKQAAEIMEELNLQFFNADGSMRTMAEIAEELRTKMGGLSEEALNASMTKLFGTDAMRTGIMLMQQGGEGIQKFREIISQASAEEQAAARMQGFNGAMLKLRSALEGLAIAIADSGMLQFMTDLVNRLAAWTSKMAEANPALLKWVTIIGGAAVVLGPLVLGLGATVSGFAALVKAAPVFVAAAKSIGAAVALMGGPLTLLVSALAALAAAWVFYGDEITAYVSGWIERLDGALGGALSAVIETAKAVVSGFIEHIRLVFQMLGQILTGDWSGAMETFKQLWANSWGAVLTIVGNTVTAIGDWLQNKLGAIFDWVGQKIETVKGYFAGLYQAVVGGSYIPDLVDGIIAEMGRLQDGFVKPAADMTGEVGASFEGLRDQVAGVFDELIQTGKVSSDTLKNLVGSIVGQMLGIGNVFNPTVPGAGGGGIGGLITAGIGALFGGFLADGGLAMAGRPYVVGERGAELFVPHTTGTVEPNGSGGGGVTQVFNVTTPNADSFRRSERQIMRSARMSLQRG